MIFLKIHGHIFTQFFYQLKFVILVQSWRVKKHFHFKKMFHEYTE